MTSRGKRPQFEFAIIAGELKGKKIVAPDLGITRPPLTRLRKSIFDFLQPYLPDAHYLDLFSGTGSYLFEAVSRGVSGAVGVEMETRLAEAINSQAHKFGVVDRLSCLVGDVFEVIPQLGQQREKFDIVMIAPPQYQGFVDRTLATLAEHPVSTDDGLIICQHDSSETRRIDFSAFEILQQRKYGNTTFTILADSNR
ncbi:MAG: RsmD family RNA methyltransferase [Candidatus Zixiibacteriota bacterium]|jgi:16S rRNA (guanine(966)-N(2))-methyltransferase RsmD